MTNTFMLIKSVSATWIIDSRAMPTIKAIVKTENATGIGHAPSGASKGQHEAIELRDNKNDFHGMGVYNAIKNIKAHIAKAIVGKNVSEQEDIDNSMIKIDGTKNKSKLGANATIACSIACLDAAAKENNMELFEYIAKKYKRKPKIPYCMFNIINGGKHAGNKLSIQEFLIVPIIKDVRQAVKASMEIYQELKEEIKKAYGRHSINVGDEGGFSPNMQRNWQAIEIIKKAIEKTGYEKEIKISIDAAADSFYNSNADKYEVDEKMLDKEELLDYYKELVKTYGILSIEDPFYEKHGQQFKLLKRYVKVIGDDLTVTNIELVKKNKDFINGIIIKPNQIGTISETIKAFDYAIKHVPFIITSHRSGETESSFIADFAVGIASPYVKFGAPARGERTVKYNRLMDIGDELGMAGN
ncbi:MAG: enolase [Candidatus Anstonellales archaeon]